MYKYIIETDDDTESPRDWNNLSTMFCSHRRYTLGDEQFHEGDFDSWEAVHKYLKDKRDAEVILPLYLYDHSGLSMFTDGSKGYRQHEAWDSGQVGYIYMTADEIQREYGSLNEDTTSTAKSRLEGEIEEYSQYLQGDVYRVMVLDDDGDVVESLGGIYGYEYAEQELELMKKQLGGSNE